MTPPVEGFPSTRDGDYNDNYQAQEDGVETIMSGSINSKSKLSRRIRIKNKIGMRKVKQRQRRLQQSKGGTSSSTEMASIDHDKVSRSCNDSSAISGHKQQVSSNAIISQSTREKVNDHLLCGSDHKHQIEVSVSPDPKYNSHLSRQMKPSKNHSSLQKNTKNNPLRKLSSTNTHKRLTRTSSQVGNESTKLPSEGSSFVLKSIDTKDVLMKRKHNNRMKSEKVEHLDVKHLTIKEAKKENNIVRIHQNIDKELNPEVSTSSQGGYKSADTRHNHNKDATKKYGMKVSITSTPSSTTSQNASQGAVNQHNYKNSVTGFRTKISSYDIDRDTSAGTQHVDNLDATKKFSTKVPIAPISSSVSQRASQGAVNQNNFKNTTTEFRTKISSYNTTRDVLKDVNQSHLKNIRREKQNVNSVTNNNKVTSKQENVVDAVYIPTRATQNISSESELMKKNVPYVDIIKLKQNDNESKPGDGFSFVPATVSLPYRDKARRSNRTFPERQHHLKKKFDQGCQQQPYREIRSGSSNEQGDDDVDDDILLPFVAGRTTKKNFSQEKAASPNEWEWSLDDNNDDDDFSFQLTTAGSLPYHVESNSSKSRYSDIVEHNTFDDDDDDLSFASLPFRATTFERTIVEEESTSIGSSSVSNVIIPSSNNKCSVTATAVANNRCLPRNDDNRNSDDYLVDENGFIIHKAIAVLEDLGKTNDHRHRGICEQQRGIIIHNK